MLTVFLVLAVCATLAALASSFNKCPVWIPVFILCVIELLRAMPLGK